MTKINASPAWFRKHSRCKYSHLPISSPEIFVSSAKDSKYFLEIAKLGDLILLIKVSGYARASDMKESITFTDEYISKFFPAKKNIIVIEEVIAKLPDYAKFFSGR